MNPLLLQLLEQHGGTLSVEQFMQNALYHPTHGYYTSHIKTVGKQGDFSTSASLHPILGQAIARWCAAHHSPSDTPCMLIEIGAGDGSLAKNVIQHLPDNLLLSLQYHIVEISSPLKDTQQHTLQSLPIHWHNTIQQALKATHGEALIFSNELVDAFPCVLISIEQQEWSEIHLQAHNGTIQEVRQPLDDPRLQTIPCTALGFFDQHTSPQRCELHLSYQQWLASWLPLLRRGAILTIDYGDTVKELYTRRTNGTLRGYNNHTRMENERVYQNFGQQDLTADVNFSDLILWGKQLGLQNEFLYNQRDFILQQCPEITPPQPDNSPLFFLLDPLGMGSAFQALSQIKTN